MRMTSVSYTHLDVYKRQLLNFSFYVNGGDVPKQPALTLAMFPDDMAAVSYTHLDVYKRQEKTLPHLASLILPRSMIFLHMPLLITITVETV